MKDIKKFFNLLLKSWYYVLLFLVSFLLFARLYFPDDLLMKLILDSIEKQTKVVVKIESGGSMSFVPVLGVSFSSAVITIPNSPGTIKLGPSTLGISFFSLLTLSPKFKLESDSFGGHISIVAKGLPLDPQKTTDEVDLNLNLQSIDLKELGLKNFVPINLLAQVEGSVEGKLNLLNFAYSVLKFDLSFANIKVVDSNIMGFAIPSVSLKKGSVVAVFDKSNLNVTKIMLGSGSEDVDLFVSGQLKLKFNNPYEGKIKLKLGGVLETQFGQFLNMSLAQAKGSDGYYSFKIKGDMRTFPPQISPEK
jgi:type II secretion system protein N